MGIAMVQEKTRAKLLLLTLVFAATSLAACGAAPAAPTPALLKVIAEPPNTSVYVDDNFVGTGRVLAVKPAVIHPGERFITFTATGYFPHDLKLTLPSGTTSINIRLRPIPE
jgi:hypothetical protein